MGKYSNVGLKSTAFSEADYLFKSIKDSLNSNKLIAAEHGEIENFIKKEGFEVMRLLFQGHLDIRASKEPDLGSVKSNGMDHDYMRSNQRRTLNTIFGDVNAHRKGYSIAGTDSVFPQDAALNLSPDQYSDGLKRQVAHSVAFNSFEQSVANIISNTASSVPNRQVKEIAKHLSVDFDDFYKSKQIDIHSKTGILVLSVDGKGIVMRQDDLRPATKKAAQSEEHKKETRLSKGEKRNRKRMATVASVYDINPFIRTPESIMDRTKVPVGTVVPRPEYKRVWASIEKSSQEVIEDMFYEALRRDPKQERKWVILVDGHKAQLKQIKRVKKKLQVNATIVLDFIHVLEYLWKAAYCFHDEKSKAAELWVKKHALNVLNGRACHVAAGIHRSCTKRGMKKKDRNQADICANYLLKNKKYLQYSDYMSKGYPIATGVIEGACRYLIKDRMDITGARWRLKGAEAILKIRALVICGDFEDYFKFHKARERKRNYPYYYEISHKMAA
jgi:hypothetical protein